MYSPLSCRKRAMAQIGLYSMFAWLAVSACQVVCGQLPEVKRIIFVGDSITHGGGYITSLEAAIIAQHPERHMELINVGLPSETVSGLSEPGHAGGKFPRPDLHERLTRVLDQTKPNLVVACYGMNDGIYYPFGEDRFAKFKSGIERLHQEVEKRGAKIIHLTPAFFDALPIKERLLPAGLEDIVSLTKSTTTFWKSMQSGSCPSEIKVGKFMTYTAR